MKFLFPDRDSSKKEGLSVHVHLQKSHVPMTFSNFLLFHLKTPTLVQMAQQPSTKLHFLHKLPGNSGQPKLFFVHPNGTHHAVKYARLPRGRMEVRIWFEIQFDNVSPRSPISEVESIGEKVE